MKQRQKKIGRSREWAANSVRLLICAFLSLSQFSCQPREDRLNLAEVMLDSGQGQTQLVRLTDRLAEEGTVINFWASWCKPCRQEMPSLIGFGKKLDRKGIRLLLVSLDKNLFAYEEYLRVIRRESPQVAENMMIFRVGNPLDLDIESMPQTYLVDKKGKVRHVYVGAKDWSAQPLQAEVLRRLQ